MVCYFSDLIIYHCLFELLAPATLTFSSFLSQANHTIPQGLCPCCMMPFFLAVCLACSLSFSSFIQKSPFQWGLSWLFLSFQTPTPDISYPSAMLFSFIFSIDQYSVHFTYLFFVSLIVYRTYKIPMCFIHYCISRTLNSLWHRVDAQ